MKIHTFHNLINILDADSDEDTVDSLNQSKNSITNLHHLAQINRQKHLERTANTQAARREEEAKQARAIQKPKLVNIANNVDIKNTHWGSLVPHHTSI